VVDVGECAREDGAEDVGLVVAPCPLVVGVE
jgi:hypothetical protein